MLGEVSATEHTAMEETVVVFGDIVRKTCKMNDQNTQKRTKRKILGNLTSWHGRK
uniref:Uncharacterized protein n=1 Tax=Arion vulgaris TaxID=1028688 RepID=A0A0B6YZL5_9EUPU